MDLMSQILFSKENKMNLLENDLGDIGHGSVVGIIFSKGKNEST